MFFVPDTNPAVFLSPPVSCTPTNLCKVIHTRPVSTRLPSLLSVAKVL